MTAPPTPTLAEQRRQLREQLATQRVALAAQMAAADTPGTYPRSLTMRWLMPVLAATLARRFAGARVAAAVPVLLTLGRMWRAGAAARSAARNPAGRVP